MDSEEDPRFSDPAAMSVMHLGSHVILKPPVKPSRGVFFAPETIPPQDTGDSGNYRRTLESIMSGKSYPGTLTSSNEFIVVSRSLSRSLGPYTFLLVLPFLPPSPSSCPPSPPPPHPHFFPPSLAPLNLDPVALAQTLTDTCHVPHLRAATAAIR